MKSQKYYIWKSNCSNGVIKQELEFEDISLLKEQLLKTEEELKIAFKKLKHRERIVVAKTRQSEIVINTDETETPTETNEIHILLAPRWITTWKGVCHYKDPDKNTERQIKRELNSNLDITIKFIEEIGKGQGTKASVVGLF